MSKVKVATAWLGVCSGCHMSLLDLDEKIIDLLQKIDIVYSPIVDIKEIPPVDLGIITGAITNEDNLEIAKEMREKAKLILVIGDCGVTGGVCSMRNAFGLKETMEYAYNKIPSNANDTLPNHPDIPKLLENVIPVNQAIKVDLHLPGCPPKPEQIAWILGKILEGKIPEEIPSDILRYGRG